MPLPHTKFGPEPLKTLPCIRNMATDTHTDALLYIEDATKKCLAFPYALKHMTKCFVAS